MEILPKVWEYVSAIQLISLSPVPMSGAGTSMPGPRIGKQHLISTGFHKLWNIGLVHLFRITSFSLKITILPLHSIYKHHGWLEQKEVVIKQVIFRPTSQD